MNLRAGIRRIKLGGKVLVTIGVVAIVGFVLSGLGHYGSDGWGPGIMAIAGISFELAVLPGIALLFIGWVGDGLLLPHTETPLKDFR